MSATSANDVFYHKPNLIPKVFVSRSTNIFIQLSQNAVVSPKTMFGHNSAVLNPLGLRIALQRDVHISYILG